MDGLTLVPATGSHHSSGELSTEPRREARYHTHFHACTVSEQGEVISCRLVNLSLSGLQLQLSARAMPRLLPVKCGHDLHQPVHFRVDFTVPTLHSGNTLISIDCMLIYCRRHTCVNFVIGVKFVEFHQGCDKALRDYIEHYGEAY